MLPFCLIRSDEEPGTGRKNKRLVFGFHSIPTEVCSLRRDFRYGLVVLRAARSKRGITGKNRSHGETLSNDSTVHVNHIAISTNNRTILPPGFYKLAYDSTKAVVTNSLTHRSPKFYSRKHQSRNPILVRSQVVSASRYGTLSSLIQIVHIHFR